eukprot:1158485-Pelagomonas_calceolata.AAC.16
MEASPAPRGLLLTPLTYLKDLMENFKENYVQPSWQHCSAWSKRWKLELHAGRPDLVIWRPAEGWPQRTGSQDSFFWCLVLHLIITPFQSQPLSGSPTASCNNRDWHTLSHMNQADVLGLAKHVLLQLSCPRRQNSGKANGMIMRKKGDGWTSAIASPPPPPR